MKISLVRKIAKEIVHLLSGKQLKEGEGNNFFKQLVSSSQLYEKAGIQDIGKFYANKFAYHGKMDFLQSSYLNRMDIIYAKMMWILNNVRPGSKVLDVGCGAGTLACLKRKNVYLAGVDYSKEALRNAKENGYEEVHQGDIHDLPYPGNSFDYVVSLDVFGHIPFESKDRLIKELKRVLKPDGVMLHGIECGDINYDSMTEAELKKFIEVDGHVGIENKEEVIQRFKQFFRYVNATIRFFICSSHQDIIKHHEKYGLSYDSDFIAYLKAMSDEEIRVFNIAMGYVFAKISEMNISAPGNVGGFLFLKASDKEMGPLTGEYPLPPYTPTEIKRRLLMKENRAFIYGWYPVEHWPQEVRWMGKKASLRMELEQARYLNLKLKCLHPDVNKYPVIVEVIINDSLTKKITLTNREWHSAQLDIHRMKRSQLDLVIRVNRTWRPCDVTESDDQRDLGIAVSDIWVD